MRRFDVIAIRRSMGMIVCAGLIAFGLVSSAQNGTSGLGAVEREVRALGIRARIEPDNRDRLLVELATILTELGEKDERALRAIQGAFQYALLLACDRDIYDTLKSATIEAVDNALERLFTIEDIKPDLRWEDLVYVYGFFNRDVTVEEIAEVRDTIDSLSENRRKQMYPVYPHAFDALFKPLAMGPLTDAGRTADALKVAIPVLKDAIVAEAERGYAFHPPSHAVIVIAPMYDRWADADGPEGAVVRELLGTREDFVDLLKSRVVGGVPSPDDLPRFHYDFYANDGAYFANAFARIDARGAVDVLKRSLGIYAEQIGDSYVMAYTRRALVALGDPEARATLENALSSANNAKALDTLVWICRNARGEGKTYAEDQLAGQLGCTPTEALEVYLKRQLAVLAR
jgi:hypothetical protein